MPASMWCKIKNKETKTEKKIITNSIGKKLKSLSPQLQMFKQFKSASFDVNRFPQNSQLILPQFNQRVSLWVDDSYHIIG